MTSVFGLHTCFRQKKGREMLTCGVIPAVLSCFLSPFGLTDRPNRSQLEVLLRLKQQSNAAFSFLDDQDPAHPYYVFLKSWGESALAAEYARQQRLQAERAEARRRREQERREEEEREAAAAKGPSLWWCALSVEHGGPLACLSMRCNAVQCGAMRCITWGWGLVCRSLARSVGRILRTRFAPFAFCSLAPRFDVVIGREEGGREGRGKLADQAEGGNNRNWFGRRLRAPALSPVPL